MKKKYALLNLIIFFCMSAYAQNQTTIDSLKTDSINKANAQIKSQTQTQPVASTPKNKKDTRPLSQRINFDLNTSFWITPSSTFFEFSPVVSYMFPKVLSIGTGPTYIYNHDRVKNISTNGWGGKVFSKAQLTSWFYAYTEYQGISNQYVTGYDATTKKVTKGTQYVDSWFLSLGINIRITKRRGINMQALYDVLYNKETSPYYGAWTYRVGFGF